MNHISKLIISKNVSCHRYIHISTKNKLKFSSPMFANSPASSDWIGPRDKASNIRPFKFSRRVNESQQERELREMKEEAQEWNMEFWSKHNKSFTQAKEEYIEKKLAEINENRSAREKVDKISPEELSVFFKEFLDANHDTHKTYNREWYGKNFRLLWKAVQVKLHNLSRMDR